MNVFIFEKFLESSKIVIIYSFLTLISNRTFSKKNFCQVHLFSFIFFEISVCLVDRRIEKVRAESFRTWFLVGPMGGARKLINGKISNYPWECFETLQIVKYGSLWPKFVFRSKTDIFNVKMKEKNVKRNFDSGDLKIF